jgi:formylglycine-generating enzyme required for sulfatase activity
MKINKTILSLATISALAVSAYGVCGGAIDFGNQNLTNMKLSGDMDANSNQITGLKDPTNSQDAATKTYVDDLTSNLGSPALYGTIGTKVTKAKVDDTTNHNKSGETLWTKVPATTLPSGHRVEGFEVFTYEARGANTTSNKVDPVKVSISWNDALKACKNVNANLITNDQWLAIAYNVARQDDNYVGGILKRGNNLNNTNGESGADCGAGASAIADTVLKCSNNTRLKLSNGQEIVDFAGNVWEWTDFTVKDTGIAKSDTDWSDENTTTWGDNKPTGVTAISVATGAGAVWSADTGTLAALRGGHWRDNTGAGAFALTLDFAPSLKAASAGFRCTR